MKYIKLFEDLEDDDYDNTNGIDEKTINSIIEEALVEFSDDGLIISSFVKVHPNRIGNIRISNINRVKCKVSDYKESFNYLYDVLMSYDYAIYNIYTNSRFIEDGKFTDKDFEYIWDAIINSTNDKFLSVQFSVFKR